MYICEKTIENCVFHERPSSVAFYLHGQVMLNSDIHHICICIMPQICIFFQPFIGQSVVTKYTTCFYILNAHYPYE